MACAKAVIFDYVGTLVNCRNYTMEASREKLHTALVNEGFEVDKDKFLEAYITAHEKYRKIRYEQLREVTNAVWVAEALCNLGFKVTADDYRIKAALNVFFKDYIDMLELRAGAKKLIKQAKEQCKVALISNFTHAPVIHTSLRQLRINTFFNVGCDFRGKRLAKTKQPHIPRRPKQATSPSERSSLHRRQPNRRH